MIVDETSRKEIAAISETVSCISVRHYGGIQERFNQTQGMAFVGCTGSPNYFLPSVLMELRLPSLISRSIYLLFVLKGYRQKTLFMNKSISFAGNEILHNLEEL